MNIRFIKKIVLNEIDWNILKGSFLNYINPLLMGINVIISDIRAKIYDKVEQKDPSLKNIIFLKYISQERKCRIN